MESVTIRNMEANEAAAVREIGRKAFTGIESLWVAKPKQALVAVKEGKIVGAILYKFIKSAEKKIGYVDYAFIDPDHHNQGIGNILYKEAADYLWEQGCDALTAVVKDDNVGSWGLFQKNGFIRVSLPELIRQFGFIGAFRQYFETPFCFAIGMEYYVALKEKKYPSGKGGSMKQILSFFMANSLLFFPVFMTGRQGGNVSTYLLAYLMILFVGIISEFAATKISSDRNWKFRLNNGGAAVCVLVNLGSLFPMIGNWYPQKYEKTEVFQRDMGITALVGWISLLAVTCFSIFSGSDHSFVYSAAQIGIYLLIYRMIPFYPFESFGGRRVYEWNKWIYAGITICTLVVVISHFAGV